MRLRSQGTPLPLLVKDLTELAARKRTYVLRFLYCCALATCFLLTFRDLISGGLYMQYGQPVLGRGREMFDFIVYAQFIAIFVFLPATMSTAITYEKERETLSLLFLTRLRPWEILLQKYLGRLVPMFTMMLLSLPLLAVAYAFGGVSTDYLASGVYLLFLTCLQVGAFSLMFSTFCSRSATAFVCSYLFGLLFYLGPLLLAAFLDASDVINLRGRDQDVLFCHFPPYLFDRLAQKGFGSVVAASIPAALTVLGFLVLSRVMLVRHAVARTGSMTLKALKMLDAFWDRANRLTGGIVLYREPDTLPDDQPVAWLEGKKKSLGKLRYRVRLLMLLEVPVVFIGTYMLVLHQADSTLIFGILTLCLWAIAGLLICVQSASAFSSERARQTMDVLLSTALPGASIVRQKARALRGLAIVLMAPIATLIVMKLLAGTWHSYYRGTPDNNGIPIALSCGTVLIYPPMITWVSMWIGMKVRSQARAIIMSISALVCWCVIPWLVLMVLASLMHPSRRGIEEVFSFLTLLSPATAIVAAEFWSELTDLFEHSPTLMIAVNFALYGGLWLGFRTLCLVNADRYLGRVWQNAGPELKAPPGKSAP